MDGSGSCPNVTFEDNDFKDNKALNDQGKDEGTIIVNAQLNLNMSWSLRLFDNKNLKNKWF
jgi:hypothetical protein